MVGGAHRAPEGDRRLDRQGGRRRAALRPALRGQVARARRRPVHRRKPVAASRRARRRGRADRPRRRRRGRAPTAAQGHAADRFRRDGAGAPAYGRRAAGEKRDTHQLHRAHALARRIYRRRGPLHGRRDGAARRHLHRPGIRHAVARRPGRRGARGDGRALRRADRLRLQLRRARVRSLQARPAADPESAR